jgi:hypothetical protein
MLLPEGLANIPYWKGFTPSHAGFSLDSLVGVPNHSGFLQNRAVILYDPPALRPA